MLVPFHVVKRGKVYMLSGISVLVCVCVCVCVPCCVAGYLIDTFRKDKGKMFDCVSV